MIINKMLNLKSHIVMSNKNKVKHSKKEEEQANKVVKIIFIALIVLGLLLMLGMSFFG